MAYTFRQLPRGSRSQDEDYEFVKLKDDICNDYLTFSSNSPFTIGIASNAYYQGYYKYEEIRETYFDTEEQEYYDELFTNAIDMTVEYSLDLKKWFKFEVATPINSVNNTVYVRGRNNTTFYKLIEENSLTHVVNMCFTLNGTNISCDGNIETLLDWKTVANGEHPQMGESCFFNLFYNCTALITAPELPATTLAVQCYRGLFEGCTSLTVAPTLPATTLTQDCYYGMFKGCSSLTTAPMLSATTMVRYCYGFMFQNCTSLITPPELSATTLAVSCYSRMFEGCTALITAPELPATTLAENCYFRMFDGCTSLTTIPELPATTLSESCYHGMFQNCTSLKIAKTTNGKQQIFSGMTDSQCPDTTADYCVNNMFFNTGGTFTGTPVAGTSYYVAWDPYLTFSSDEEFTLGVDADDGVNWNGTVEYSTDLETWTEWTVTDYMVDTLSSVNGKLYLRGTGNMYFSRLFDGDTISTQFVLTGTDIACEGNIETLLDYATVTAGNHPIMYNYCYYGMFRGCTSLTEAPALPATTLANHCYDIMFYGCTSLTTAPALPATTLYTYCYREMFHGCTSLTTVPELPATTLAEGCYEYMFMGCTSFTKAPVLPATTLVKECYYGMFRGCASLTEASALPATTLATYCYGFMFYGCTSLKVNTTSGSPIFTGTTGNVCPYTSAKYCVDMMFTSTGGTFTGTPVAGTAYYYEYKEDISYTPPVGKSLTYDGTTKTLVTAGSVATSGFTMEYSTDNSTWSTTLPSAYQAQTYTIYYRIIGNEDYSDVYGNVTASITKTPATVTTAPTAKTNLTYTGNAQALVNAGAAQGGTIVYSVDSTSDWSSAIPQRTDSDEYTVYWKVVPDDMHGWTSGYQTISVNINPLTPTYVTVPTAKTGLEYTDTALDLVNPGAANGGTIYYRVNGGTWSTSVPQAEAPGTYTVEWYIRGNSNYADSSIISVEIEVGGEIPDYLCFTAQEANSTVGMRVTGTPTQGQAFEYSRNGLSWSTFTPGTTTITLSNIGDKVYFRGDNTTVGESDNTYYSFTMTGKIASSGNIMSLLDKTCKSNTISHAYCYECMFDYCTSLTSAPELPATTLASYCYGWMFEGCNSLTTAPELPATTLADYCYEDMFYGCTSLTTAPALPATTLTGNCYTYMFAGCTSLTEAPELPATTLVNYCYYEMFNGCISLTEAPELPATTLADGCYCDMFKGCTSLTTAPELPATELADDCYCDMFKGCTSLTTAPELPATTLADYCYEDMFYGCTSLTTAPELPATTLAESCYFYMFYSCTSLQVYSSSGSGHTKEWRIPTSGTASSYTSQNRMFYGTTGDYASATSVSINTTFYTQNDPV